MYNIPKDLLTGLCLPIWKQGTSNIPTKAGTLLPFQNYAF